MLTATSPSTVPQSCLRRVHRVVIGRLSSTAIQLRRQVVYVAGRKDCIHDRLGVLEYGAVYEVLRQQ
jgi:hypothetical protein